MKIRAKSYTGKLFIEITFLGFSVTVEMKRVLLDTESSKNHKTERPKT